MLIIGLGHKARQGKNAAAAALLQQCPIDRAARIYAFADALRAEVKKAIRVAGGDDALIAPAPLPGGTGFDSCFDSRFQQTHQSKENTMRTIFQLLFQLFILPAFGRFFANPISYRGRGSILQLSPDNATYTAIAQLEKFDHSGGDVTKVETTCLDSPGTGKFWQPVDTDHKDIDFEGILDPQNVTIQSAAVYFQTMALLYFKCTFTDSPATIMSGQCYVSSWKLFEADAKGVQKFSGKLLIQGNVTWTISGQTPVTV